MLEPASPDPAPLMRHERQCDIIDDDTFDRKRLSQNKSSAIYENTELISKRLPLRQLEAAYNKLTSDPHGFEKEFKVGHVSYQQSDQ